MKKYLFCLIPFAICALLAACLALTELLSDDTLAQGNAALSAGWVLIGVVTSTLIAMALAIHDLF